MSYLSRYGVFLDELPMNRRHWLVFAVCSAGMMFDAVDIQVMALAAPLIGREWKLTPQTIGMILSSTGVGMLIGSYLFGTISDRIGRRTGFQLTIAIFAVFTGLSVFVQNTSQLMVLRFVIGLGIGGFIPIDTAMLTEFMPSKTRGRMLALWAMFLPIGYMLVTFVGKPVIPIWGWRGLFLIGVTPAIMVFLVRLLVPESPRFLIRNGRQNEAEKVISWIALGKPLPEVPSEELVLSSTDMGATARTTVATLFAPAYRRRTAMAWALWFGYCFSYFGVLLWLPSLLIRHRGVPAAQVLTYIIGFMLCGVVGRVLVSFLVDLIGRRNTIPLIGFCACITLIVFGRQTTYTNLLLFGYIYAFFHEGALSAVAPYTPELYPTHARATGVGYANGAGRIASIISPIAVGYVVPIGLSDAFVLLACGWIIGAIAVIVLGKETRQMRLEAAALEVDTEVATRSKGAGQ